MNSNIGPFELTFCVANIEFENYLSILPDFSLLLKDISANLKNKNLSIQTLELYVKDIEKYKQAIESIKNCRDKYISQLKSFKKDCPDGVIYKENLKNLNNLIKSIELEIEKTTNELINNLQSKGIDKYNYLVTTNQQLL